jgi:hypothetical protein
MKEKIDRRRFLKNSLVAGGAAVALQSFEEKVLGAELKSAQPGGASSAKVEPLQIPKGKIKNLEVSRVICGGNLIGGWAHSRDLIYTSALVKAYHTDEKVFETLRLAEQRGVNTVLTNPAADRVLNDYWFHQDGKIQWISDCATGNLKEGIKRSIDKGAHAVYLQGGRCDQMVRDNRLGELEGALKFMQEQSVPCGLGAHSLETVKKCVSAGYEPDFWVKTLHQDNYWSATPAKNRQTFDEVNGAHPEHELPHDNMWCTDAQETIAYMAALRKPWIAFKVLAAGAIHPRHAFQWSFESGADFICVGMFDFQVVENTAIAAQALKAVAQKGRPRAWMA